MIIGSGSITHNLRAIFGGRLPVNAPTNPSVSAFTNWVAEHVADDRIDDLLHMVELAPDGHFHHPTMEHILPFHVAMGAGSDGTSLRGKRLHESSTYGMLGMDVYAFGETG